MKSTCTILGVASVLFGAATLPASAATYVWFGGTGNWSATGNWSPSGTTTLSDDTQFNSGSGNVGLQNGLRSANSITFGSSSGAFTFNSGTGNPSGMSIGAGGIVNNSTSTQTFNSSGNLFNIAVSASQSWTASSGDLAFNTTVGLGANTLTLSPAASRTITISQAISGTGGISKTGGGTLNLNAANSYSGSTALSAGTLSFGVGQSMSGALNMSGGAILSPNNQTVTFGSLSLGGSSTISFGTDGTSQSLTFGSASHTAGTLTIQNWSAAATSDKLFITANPGSTFLANVNFTGFGSGATWKPSGEIVPVPEPETYTLVAGVALLGVAAIRRRMRNH